MFFVCTFDVILELPTIVRELFGHFVCPAWHIPIDCRRKVHDLTDLKFVRGHHLYPRFVYVESIHLARLS
jgi:hypothetical protein